MSNVVGVYVCPRGVYLVECRVRGAGLEVVRTLEQPALLRTVDAAADHLVGVLAAAGIRKAQLAIVIRGFDVVHHVISLPPAPDAMLGTILDREIRRLEPVLGDPVLGWMPLPSHEAVSADQPMQKHLMVAAAPRAAVETIEQLLLAAGHTLVHLTALPAAFQRLTEEFEETKDTTALVVPLPDGAFIGFFLGGALRLSVEPPLLEQDSPESVAMAEEVELGAMFVRQQFRGAQIERVTIGAPDAEFAEAETILSDKLGIPVHRLDIHGLSAAALAAMGAILDSRSPRPLALAGTVGRKKQDPARGVFERASYAAVAIAAIVGAWTLYQAVTARRAADTLTAAQHRVEQESFGIVPMRQTAAQRKLIRDAVSVMELVTRDRNALQQMLVGIGSGIVPPIRLDSLRLDRGTDGWVATLAGSSSAFSNGRAVQALHDFYRDIPRRVIVEQLALESLAYADSTSDEFGAATVRFGLSFVVPSTKKD